MLLPRRFAFGLLISTLSVPALGGTGLQAQLEALQAAAEAAESSALVVLREGEPLLEWYDEQGERSIETMSVTKSVVALGVARMLTTGELESLDTPVAEFFPEWRQGQKREITIRHLLNHTSGLQNHPHTSEEIYPSPDFVQLALAAELDHPPGEDFAYNNKATNLIAGLFPPITGQRMDAYIAEELFDPLGIEDWSWTRDEAGNPHGMAGLSLRPMGLARLGQLVLDRGKFEGRTLIEPAIVGTLMAPGSPHNETAGLLWWRQPAQEAYVIDEVLIDDFREAGVDADIIDGLAAIRGEYESQAQVAAALAETFGDNWQEQVFPETRPHGLSLARREASEDIAAWYGEGYLGQFLVVVPKTGIVAVRMREYAEGLDPESQFETFVKRVVELGTGD